MHSVTPRNHMHPTEGQKQIEKGYMWATAAAAAATGLPLFKLGLLAAGIMTAPLHPLGWGLLIGGAAIFLISSIAYACFGPGTFSDRIQAIGVGGLIVATSPITVPILLICGIFYAGCS